MRQSELQRKIKDEEIVKCACGLPMRQKNWADHWNGCKFGSSVPVTEQDRANLEAEEARRKQSALEHQEWMRRKFSSVS